MLQRAAFTAPAPAQCPNQANCVRPQVDLGKPIMFVGGAGVGKTQLVKGKLGCLPEEVLSLGISFNYFTDVASFQKVRRRGAAGAGGCACACSRNPSTASSTGCQRSLVHFVSSPPPHTHTDAQRPAIHTNRSRTHTGS